MSVLTDRFMLNTHAAGHQLLSTALDVAAKVHTHLPDSMTLRAWTLLPCEVAGEVVSLDDDTAIGWIVWLAQQPNWHFEESLMKRSDYLREPYVTIAAVTDVDDMAVKIWAHVPAKSRQATAETATEEGEAA